MLRHSSATGLALVTLPPWMKVAIIGGGAIGGVWASQLARAGNDVTVVDVSSAVLGRVSGPGLLVETPEGPQPALPLRATCRPEEAGQMDAVWFFIKAQHTASAAQLARPLVAAGTAVVTQQNGWGNADVLSEVYPAPQLVVGVTYHSATVVGPGHVKHTGRGQSYIGPYVDGGDLAGAERVGRMMNEAGLETTVTAEVKTEIWKKLILNCATLPTSALTRLAAGDVGQPGALLELVDAIAAEAVQVAQALGYDVDMDERRERIHAILANGGRGKASMLQDVEGSRKTEIEVVNDAVVRAAERLGIVTPLNRAMVALVGGLERSYL